MAAWVEDIHQALENLNGQASLNQIYEEVARIRKGPLSTHWRATIQKTIEDHSSDSKNFRGKDVFRKAGRGVWALRDQTQPAQSPEPAVNIRPRESHKITSHPAQEPPPSQRLVGLSGSDLKRFLPTESIEEIANILGTIKQYRDYQDPAASRKEYVMEFFHILGFHTQELNPRLIALYAMGSNHTPKAVVIFLLPQENFQEIIPDLQWESYLFFAASYYEIDWGVLTNGLQLKVVNFCNSEPQQPFYWSDLDGIIGNEKLDSFCTIYKVFSFIKGDKGNSTDEHGKQPKKGRDSR